ncbi:hypothetical protein EDB83DRAFT_1650704 [Lactarius deliciosus]|nr:hypothetical protein EDB83DRAFT_1650704 [Lactarius deliciosus]
MHAYITNSRVIRTCVSPWQSSGFNNSRSTFDIDPQNSSITTFRFSSADSPYSDHAQTSSGFVLTSRLLREGRPLIERVVGNPLLNSASAHSETEIDEQQSPMSKRQQSLFSKTAGRSASTTLPSLARSPQDDVFTESRPLEHAKRPYRGDLAGVQRAGTWGDLRSLPTLPTLSSDSSGSSISTLATPASPSPAPRHVRRAAQARLSLPTPTPTPAAAEPGRRRAHARMSLMFPLPTPGTSATESRAAYRNSLDLSELARCRLWDARDNVRVLDKETEYVQR